MEKDRLFVVLALISICTIIVGVKGGEIKGRDNVIAKGKCGLSLTWTLTNDGTLVVNGTGEMTSFSNHGAPWNDVRSSIKIVVIEEGVTSIGMLAFYDCTSLTEVFIPASVSAIVENPFYGSTSLVRLEVKKDNAYFKSIDGVLYNRDVTTVFAYPAGSPRVFFKIPDSVTLIRNFSFGYCVYLADVFIPDSVSTIATFAFFGCQEITHLTIPASVKSIETSAFKRCSRLMSVYYLGDTQMNNDAFLDSLSLQFVCVSPDYNYVSFCQKQITSSDKCDTLHSLFNHCYEPVYINGNLKQQLRRNASDLLMRSNECVTFECDNNTGAISTGKCGNGELCVNDHCVSNETLDTGKAYVVVELKSGVKADEIDISSILDFIRVECEINTTNVIIAYETNEEGYVLRIDIYVEDEETCNIIVSAINGIDKSEDCLYDILCETESVRVSTDPASSFPLSGATIVRSTKSLLMMLVLSLLIRIV